MLAAAACFVLFWRFDCRIAPELPVLQLQLMMHNSCTWQPAPGGPVIAGYLLTPWLL